jgi:hypothetical protein
MISSDEHAKSTKDVLGKDLRQKHQTLMKELN